MSPTGTLQGVVGLKFVMLGENWHSQRVRRRRGEEEEEEERHRHREIRRDVRGTD